MPTTPAAVAAPAARPHPTRIRPCASCRWLLPSFFTNSPDLCDHPSTPAGANGQGTLTTEVMRSAWSADRSNAFRTRMGCDPCLPDGLLFEARPEQSSAAHVAPVVDDGLGCQSQAAGLQVGGDQPRVGLGEALPELAVDGGASAL
jgi:hypothetical protein